MRMNLLMCIFLWAVGCRTFAPSTPIGAAVCPGGSASGEWSGSGADAAEHYAFSGSLLQEGTKLRGLFVWRNTAGGSPAYDATVEGDIQCNSRSFTVRTVSIGVNAGYSPIYEGSFSPDFTSMTGTYNPGGGRFTAAKK
jgi:hypothetical protein